MQLSGDFSVAIDGLQVSGDISVSVDGLQVSGDLCRALCELGKLREALEYAGQQCGLATEVGEPAMMAEAYLNMALCNVRSCEFSKAVAYCRSAMQHQPEGGSVTG